MLKTQSAGSCWEERGINSELAEQKEQSKKQLQIFLEGSFIRGFWIALIPEVKEQSFSDKLVEWYRRKIEECSVEDVFTIYERVIADEYNGINQIKSESLSPMQAEGRDVEKVSPIKIKSESLSPMQAEGRDVEKVSPIKIKSESLSPMQAEGRDVEKVSPIKIKSESLSPMQQVTEAFEEKVESLEESEIKITYEEIIINEYKKINIKSEQADQAEQGQNLIDSERSKEEEDIKIVEIIKPSCLQVLEWLKHHASFFSDALGNVLCKEAFLHWTEDLVIDKKETARSLVEKKFLSTEKSYELACLYCLEEDIKNLWGELTKEQKDRCSKDEDLLMEFWALKMKGEKGKKNYECLLDSVIEDGNEVAVEYLLDNFELQQKDLVNLAIDAASISSSRCSYTHYTPIVCKLLDKMDDEQKKKLCGTSFYGVLNHLVGLQSGKYNEIVERIWRSSPIPQHVCQALLTNIVEGDSNCQKTFMGFWNRISELNKEYNRVGERLLSRLFQFNEERIEEILSSATSEEKKMIANYVKERKGLPPKDCKLSLLSLIVKNLKDEESKEFKENLISSSKSLKICAYLIDNSKFEEFRKFGKFLDIQDSDEFKKRLFESEGSDIFVNLCMKDNKNLFDEFLRWCFPDQADACKERQRLVLSYEGIEEIINTVSRLNRGSYNWQICQEKFTEWSGLSDDDFKTNLQEKQYGNVCVNFLLEQEQAGLAGQFLNWYFQEDDSKINEFKKCFIGGDRKVYFCVNGMEARKSHAVKNFLEWIDQSGRNELLAKCKALLSEEEGKEIEKIFEEKNGNVAAGQQTSGKKRLRESDGWTSKLPEKRVGRSGSPKSNMQEAEVEACEEGRNLTNF